MKIDPHEFYPPSAPELRPLGKEQTLAAWRSQGRGPAYIKMGKKVMYRGVDILDWISGQTVSHPNHKKG